jgi:hypothetical protein
VKLSYAVELQDDEKANQVKLVLPASTFGRYGGPTQYQPFGFGRQSVAASALPETTPLTVRVSIHQSSPIRSVSCPSAHPIELELGRSAWSKAAADVPEAHLASVTLTQSATLDRDFILTVLAGGLDAPRASAEARPSFEKPETVAFSVSLVPRFQLRAIAAAEWIFVIE